MLDASLRGKTSCDGRDKAVCSEDAQLDISAIFFVNFLCFVLVKGDPVLLSRFCGEQESGSGFAQNSLCFCLCFFDLFLLQLFAFSPDGVSFCMYPFHVVFSFPFPFLCLSLFRCLFRSGSGFLPPVLVSCFSFRFFQSISLCLSPSVCLTFCLSVWSLSPVSQMSLSHLFLSH